MADTPRGRLRTLNLTVGLPSMLVGGAFLVLRHAQGPATAAVLTLGVVAGVVAFERWTAGDLSRVAAPCLAVAAVVWPLGIALGPTPGGWYGLMIAGSLIVPRLRRHRAAAAVALAAYVAGVGVAGMVLADGSLRGDFVSYVFVPTGLTVVLTGFMFPNKAFYDVVKDLEESRERKAELAVARERVRFAGDLHDIHGHTLHVVKLKTALARKLVRTDPDRAEEELREIHALVGDTIKQTKELAYAQRRLNLAAELENAKNLFEAAGIEVEVVRDGEPGAAAGRLLGQVLRETTTNILRHAQATRVRITLSGSGISIVNDGPGESPPTELRGLATLRERLADDGGDLTVRQEDGHFLTAATFPGRSPR